MPRPSVVALLTLLAACGSSPASERLDGGLRHVWGVLETNGRGEGRFVVDVEEGETAMLVTGAVAAPHRTHVRDLQVPAGELVFDAFAQYDTPRNKTNAGFVASVASLNWPVLNADAQLSPGRWRVGVGTLDGDGEWARSELAVDVLLKRDPDLTSGSLLASVILTGGVADDPELLRATEAALDHWAAIYARHGIHVRWELFEHPTGDLRPPSVGSEADYEEISAATPMRSVNVVIAERIVGFDDVYGMSGDIPGPLVSSSRSAVIVSTLLAGGPDGVFSQQEERLYGETLAHEVGHYLGLFHPVEIDYAGWDAIEDTPECAEEAECLSRLSGNLMFPYPVCDQAGCMPQDLLTSEQRAVAHGHVAVD